MSQENVNFVRRIYEALSQGDVPAVLATFDPNIEWFAAENSPYAKGSPFHGPKEILERSLIRISADWENFTIRANEYLDAGDTVIMLGTYNGIRKATGKTIHAQAAHIWTIDNGKVVKWQQYTDTYQLAESGKVSAPTGELDPA